MSALEVIARVASGLPPFRVGGKEKLSTMLTVSEQRELCQIQQELRRTDHGFAWRLAVAQGALRLHAPARPVYLFVVAACAAVLRRLVTAAGQLLKTYVKGAVLMDPIALMALADAACPGPESGQELGPDESPVRDRPQSAGGDR